MNEINQAYECLSDEEKRAIYDRFGEEGLKGGMGGRGFGSFSKFFEEDDEDFGFSSIFGGGGNRKKRSGPVKGETIQRAITTTLEDLYNGKVRKLKITRNRLCKNCKGSGSSDPNMVSNCNKCDVINRFYTTS